VSRRALQRSRGQLPGRLRLRVQRAAGRERHRQLCEGGAARAGQDPVRQRHAQGAASGTRPLRRSDRDGAMSASAAPALPRSAAGRHSPWLIAVIVSIATFMEVLDVTIVNVALRHIAGSLAASLDEATWILTSYLVSNAVVLPISGWCANVVGRK